MATQSDYWAVALSSGTVVMVPTERMRQLVEDALAEGRTARLTPVVPIPPSGALVPLEWLVGR